MKIKRSVKNIAKAFGGRGKSDFYAVSFLDGNAISKWEALI